jgi:hypothetical protein
MISLNANNSSIAKHDTYVIRIHVVTNDVPRAENQGVRRNLIKDGTESRRVCMDVRNQKETSVRLIE